MLIAAENGTLLKQKSNFLTFQSLILVTSASQEYKTT